MNRYMTSGLMFLFTIAAASVSAKEAPLPPLTHDPFEQPAFLKAPAHTARRVTAEVKPKLQLRSILQAGDESMVNLNGEILTIGDIYQGYKLVEVGKQSAIFIKDGNKIKVTLRQ